MEEGTTRPGSPPPANGRSKLGRSKPLPTGGAQGPEGRLPEGPATRTFGRGPARTDQAQGGRGIEITRVDSSRAGDARLAGKRCEGPA